MLFLDLDGTVIDDAKKHYETYAALLRDPEFRGVPMPQREYWADKLDGKSWQDAARAARLFPTKFEAFRKAFEDYVESPEMLSYDSLRTGVDTFLGKMFTKVPIVLVTQRHSHPELLAQLDKLKVRKYFVEVLSGAPPHERKPTPKTRGEAKAELVKKRYRMPPTDSLWLGDSETDVHAARSLGWEVYLVEGGHLNRRRQIEADPDRLVADLPASLKHLLPGGRWQR